MDKLEFLNRLRSLRDDYSSEVPDEILHNIWGTHKISSGWFQGIYSTLSLGQHGKFIGPHYVNEVDSYLARTNFRERLTTHSDIMFADGLLTRVIMEVN